MEILPGVGGSAGSAGCSCDVLRWIEQQPQHRLTESHLDNNENFTIRAMVAPEVATIREIRPGSSIILRSQNLFQCYSDFI